MKGKRLFIFTGTHSKHVLVEEGNATDITTFMTGELFSVLGNHSVLSSSIDGFGFDGDKEEEHSAFEQGVKNGADENLLHSLFRVRTNQLLQRFSKAANYQYLSGLLIGTELEDLSKMQVGSITIVGEKHLVNNYLKGLQILGVGCTVQVKDSTECTVRGHLKIYRRLYG